MDTCAALNAHLCASRNLWHFNGTSLAAARATRGALMGKGSTSQLRLTDCTLSRKKPQKSWISEVFPLLEMLVQQFKVKPTCFIDLFYHFQKGEFEHLKLITSDFGTSAVPSPFPPSLHANALPVLSLPRTYCTLHFVFLLYISLFTFYILLFTFTLHFTVWFWLFTFGRCKCLAGLIFPQPILHVAFCFLLYI